MEFHTGQLEAGRNYEHINLVFTSKHKRINTGNDLDAIIGLMFNDLAKNLTRENIDAVINCKIETTHLSDSWILITVFGDAIRFI